jgi:Na+-translocating ferredoxin:NAD+ oxidoreductase RnfG subunit
MMDFIWFIVGILTAVAGIGVSLTMQRYSLRWLEQAGLIVGAGLIVFTIPWVAGCLLEGVPRAASMGILLFGLPGLIILAVTWRLIAKLPINEIAPQAENVSLAPFPVKQSDVPVRTKNKGKWSRPFAYVAYALLSLALISGLITTKTDFTSNLEASFPGAKISSLESNPPVFKLEYPDSTVKYATTGEGQGYGGPLVVAILANEAGTIEKLRLLSNQETPAYKKQVEDTDFVRQFLGASVSENFIVGQDIDAISGATVSCVAGAEAIREGSHRIATNYLDMSPTWTGQPWSLDIKNALIAALFCLAFWGGLFKNKWSRYIYYGASLAIIGFFANACLSIASLGTIPLGYFPPLKANPSWWILTIGTLLTIIVLAKNIWCYKLCPFFALQFFLNKISGTRIKLPDVIAAYAQRTASFLLWVSLLTIFLTRNPALGSFEPFSMAFSLNGEGLQWFLLPASIIGAFFIPTFWCRNFCPLGHGLNKLISIRNNIMKKFSPKREA